MRPKQQTSAEIVLIPKHLRMDWTDVMATDPHLPWASHKVAGVIGTHFGNKSGLAYVSQKTIAAVAGMSEPTVNRAVLDLEQRGYIRIDRREIGARSDGKKVYGGRGVANVYLPAIDSVQLSATDRGQKLLARVLDSFSKHITDDVLSAPKHITGDVLSDPHSTSNTSAKHITGDVPTLTSPSEKNSSRAREPSCPDGLGSAGDALRRVLGHGQYQSWFGKVRLVSLADGVVTMAAPTKFVRDRLVEQYHFQIQQAWQSIDSSIERVVVVVVETAA